MITKIFLLLLLLLSFVERPLCQSSGSDVSNMFVINDVTVIDGTGKPERPHMRVVVRDGNIESVEQIQPNSKIPAGYKVIDGRGKFLIPGLWDVHVHLANLDEVAIPVLPAYGITSVRDMGGDVAQLKAWRSKIEKGELLGPRVKICGPMLEGKFDRKDLKDHWEILTPEQARSTVNKLADEGVDCIKMRNFASPETYFALVATARERNLPFGGHPPWGVDPIKASDAGQTTFEHGWYPWPWKDVSPEKKLEIENTFRKNGSLVVPTLITWEINRLSAGAIVTIINDYDGKSDPRLKLISPELRKNWLDGFQYIKPQGPGSPGWIKALEAHYEQVAEMHDHGVGIMTGTDLGATMVYPGASLHQEIKLLVTKCRFTPMDALLSATIIPAKYFKMEDRLGTIEKGKFADMVLLSASPLVDIGNIDKISGVMLNGKWLDRGALDKTISDVEMKIAASKKALTGK